MKKNLITILYLLFTTMTIAQSKYDKMLTGMYEYTVPLVKHNQVVEWQKEKVFVLDARENSEFKVSHIKDAVEVGYDNFSIKSVKDIPKDAKVVVYCSVGYRSERIGEKLIKEGYKEVYNLYGGIFDWVNNGNPVYNSSGKVSKVHAYNKDWGKWVVNEKCEKVY